MTQPQYPGELNDPNIRCIFRNADDFVRRELRLHGVTLYAYMIDGLVSGGDVADYVLKPLTQNLKTGSMEELYRQALYGEVYSAVAGEAKDLDTVALKLVNGFCVVLFPGAGAVAYEAKTGEKRGLSAPEVENTVKGPKDASTETVRTNTSILRRHMRSPELRLYSTQVGKRSLTNVTVAWVEGITDPSLVERMKKRLGEIDIDGLISPAAVEEYVTGSRPTAFPLLQYTQRADKFSQGLLAGRVGLLVDGLPQGYLLPVDLGYLMSSPEDRGRDYLTASALRVLRYGALLLSLLLPAFYVAMVTYHPEMIPLPLLRSIIESKQSVPFPTILEVLGLLLAFEILQEAGIHLPQSIGQSVSIIGGLVVGSAAVEAKLISPAALIAVASAGICGFALPERDFADAIRLWRFGITMVAAVGGLFGMAVGLIALVIHLSGLTSMDVPYLAPFSAGKQPGIFRRLLKKEKWRDEYLRPVDKKNQR